MKKRFIVSHSLRNLAVILLLLFLVSCNSTSVRFTNRASDPYELFIDGQSCGVVPSRTFIDLKIEAGTHQFKAVQKEGYIAFPTEYSTNFTLETDKDREWSWGNLILPSN